MHPAVASLVFLLSSVVFISEGTSTCIEGLTCSSVGSAVTTALTNGCTTSTTACTSTCNITTSCITSGIKSLFNGASISDTPAFNANPICQSIDYRPGKCVPPGEIAPLAILPSGASVPITRLGIRCFNAGTYAAGLPALGSCAQGQKEASLCRGMYIRTYDSFSANLNNTPSPSHDDSCLSKTDIQVDGDLCVCDLRCQTTGGRCIAYDRKSQKFVSAWDKSETCNGICAVPGGKICLPSPNYLQTDNGCPDGTTYQANPCPRDSHCSADFSNKIVSSICPSGFYCKRSCPINYRCGLIEGHVVFPELMGSYGCAEGETCVPDHIPEGLSCIKSLSSPPVQSYQCPIDMLYGNPCTSGERCFPTLPGSEVVSTLCSPGYACSVDPCGANSTKFCPPSAYNASTQMCEACIRPDLLTPELECRISVYSNDTSFGCPTGMVLIPKINPCFNGFSPQRPVGYFGATLDQMPTTAGCPAGYVCGPTCGYGNYCDDPSLAAESYCGSCSTSDVCTDAFPSYDPVGQSCLNPQMGPCRPSNSGEAPQVFSNGHYACPAGQTRFPVRANNCSGLGMTCQYDSSFSVGNDSCSIGVGSFSRCRSMCGSGMVCVESISGKSTSQGCALGSSCQTVGSPICEAGLVCKPSPFSYGSLLTTTGCPSGYTCQPVWDQTGGMSINYMSGLCSHPPGLDSDNPDILCPNLNTPPMTSCTGGEFYKYGEPTCTTSCDCVYDAKNRQTSYLCPVGYVCPSDLPTVIFCSNPGYICVETDITGAHNNECGANEVCHPACPLGFTCDASASTIHPNCPAGTGCVFANNTLSCPTNQPHCIPTTDDYSATTSTGCQRPGYICSECPEGQYFNGDGCESNCDDNSVCDDDGINGTHFSLCPDEQVCVGRCPAGFHCKSEEGEGFEGGFETKHCNTYATCQQVHFCLNGECMELPLPGYTSSECPTGQGCVSIGDNSCPLSFNRMCDPTGVVFVNFENTCPAGSGCIEFSCNKGEVCKADPVLISPGCPSGKSCQAACPDGQMCLLSYYFNETSPYCDAGHICTVIPTVPSPCLNPTDRCFDDGQPGTSHPGCPAEHVCASRCGEFFRISNEFNGIVATNSATEGCEPVICAGGLVCQNISSSFPDSGIPCEGFDSTSYGSCHPVCPVNMKCAPHPNPSNVSATDMGCKIGYVCQIPSVATPIVATSPYFGSGSLAYRYPKYSVTTLSPIRSGLPPQYTTLGSALVYATRFVITSAFDTPAASIADVDGTTASFIFSVAGITRQPLPADIVTNYTKITVAGRNMETFKGFSEGGSQPVTLSNGNITCGTLLISDSAPTFPVSPLQIQNALTFSTTLPLSQSCGSSGARLGYHLSSNVPIIAGPIQGYLYTNTTIGITAAQLMSGNALTDLFFKYAWKGVASASLNVSDAKRSVVVGDASQPLLTPAATVSTVVDMVAFSTQPGGLKDITISPTTASGTLCYVGEQRAFNMESVNATSIPGVPSSCYSFETVDALHLACLKDSTCIGFSTVRVDNPGPRELPLCLHQDGTSTTNPASAYPRKFYRKPSATAIPCRTTITSSGAVDVHVFQTNLASTKVAVRVNGNIVAICGNDRAFLNSFAGLDGRCDVRALCYTGSVGSGSIVEVQPLSKGSSNGCPYSFGSTVMQTSIDAIQQTSAPYVPIDRLNTSTTVSRRIRTTSEASLTDDTSRHSVFVYSANLVALDVMQTGFSCSLFSAANKGASCPSSVVTLSTPISCQSCGGLAGFYNNGRSGESDKCDTGMFCGDFMALSPSSSSASTCTANGKKTTSTLLPYTGIVSIVSRNSLLTTQTSLCDPFVGYLHASTDDRTTSVPVYPLLTSTGTFRILPAVSSTLTNAEAVALASTFSGIPDTNLAPLDTIGPFNKRVRTYYAPWETSVVQSTIQQQLHVNGSFACIVDHNDGDATTCVFPVPTGSVTAKILVAQNDFALSTKELSVAFFDGTTSRTVSCGGSSGFGSSRGSQEQCSTYQTCANRYLYENDLSAANATTATITVTIPGHIRPLTCNYTAAIIVEFNAPEVITAFSCSSSEYKCPWENKCIPTSYFCDQMQDCADNSDESRCVNWYNLAPTESFSCTTQSTNFTANSFEKCREYAILSQSNAVTLTDTDQCIVYNATLLGSLFEAPTASMCMISGHTTYVFLPTDVTVYKRCTPSVHCQNRGDVSNVDPQDGDTCYCDCSLGYTGENCDSRLRLETISFIVISIPLSAGASTQSISRSLIASSLVSESRRITSDCPSLGSDPRNSSIVRVECTISSLLGVEGEAYLFRRTLLSPAKWGTINAALAAKGHPNISFISARGTMNPVKQLTNCSSSSSCVASERFQQLRIHILNSTQVTSVTITEEGGSSSSSSRSSHRDLSCTPAATSTTGGCIASSCDISMIGTSGSTLLLSNVSFAAADDLTATCPTPTTTMLVQQQYGNVETTTTTTVTNVEEDYRWFLIGAILVFVVGMFISILSSITCCCVHRRRLKKHVDAIDISDLSTLEVAKAHLLARYFYFHQTVVEKRLRPDLYSVIFATVALMCAVGASFLTIYYVTAFSRESNFSIMYEEYSDSSCSDSTTASMPRRIFSIPPQNADCDKMEVTGESAGAVYAMGICEGSSGTYTAKISIGASFEDCRTTPTNYISSGSCIPLSQIQPDTSRSVYVLLTCSTNQQVADRTQTLRTLTTTNDVFVDADVTVPSNKLLSNTTITSDGSTIYLNPFVVGSDLKVSTSSFPGTVSTTANSNYFDGNYAEKRLILQDIGRTFQAPSTTSTDAFSSLEEEYLSSFSYLDLDSMAPFLPSSGDYPLGYLFGGFGSSSETTWPGASPYAHRYYDVAGTLFDFGHHFSNDLNALPENAGYSISAYIRATESTNGFAFAVTDAFEHVQSNAVFTLERLAEMIENGQADASWFNQTFKVYSSLFVNGAGKTLTFGMADATLDSNRVELIEWDLQRIGVEWALNGLWHHIGIAFRVENGKVRAQLIVDGETSYSKEGWSHCVSRTPSPIQTFTGTAPVFDSQYNKISSGGMLVVGYFNGGVQMVSAIDKEMVNTDYLETGTDAMREHNEFPRQKTLILGSFLIALGTIALLILVIFSTKDIGSLLIHSTAAANVTAMKEFYLLQQEAMKAKKFFNDEQIEGTCVKGIRMSTALRWTGLSMNNFSDVLPEIHAQSVHPGQSLILLLYRVRTGDIHCESLTIDQWNSFVDKQEAEREASRFCFFFRHTKDSELDAKISTNGDKRKNDLFVSMVANYAVASTATDEHDGQFTPRSLSDNEVDVDHAAGPEGVAEITTINTGSSSASSSSSAMANVANVLAPMIVVFQSMYVWATSITFPSLYDEYFLPIFSFVSIDVAVAFPNIPTIATPLAQLAAGFIAVGLVCVFLFEDNRRFERGITKYVWRRDELEGGKAALRIHSKVPKEMKASLADPAVPEPIINVHTLSIAECRKIDLFAGKIRRVHEDDTTDYMALNTIKVSTMDGQPFEIQRDAIVLNKLLVIEESVKFEGGESPDITSQEQEIVKQPTLPISLDVIDHYCRRHRSKRLTLVSQSDIYPYSNHSECSAVVNGRPCGVSIGKMYVCGERYHDEHGVERVCTFGICEQHVRLSLFNSIVAQLLGVKNMLVTNGIGYVITVVLMFLAGAAYTPFLKTAIMIVACHPFYQCEFGRCYTFITQKFALAVFLSSSIILVLGIGFPAVLFVLLYRRKHMLDMFFFGEAYDGLYEEKDAQNKNNKKILQNDKDELNNSSISPFTPREEKTSWIHKITGRRVKLSEWTRFISTDSSGVSQQYNQGYYHWIYIPGLFILFKILVVIPAVALETKSFEQRLGSACVEIFIALFVFLTQCQTSPILLMTLRAASVHQLLVLGLQNLDLVTKNDINESIATYLIGVTLVYVIFSAVVFVSTVILPTFFARRQHSGMLKFLNKNGYDYSKAISLYLEPNEAASIENQVRGVVEISEKESMKAKLDLKMNSSLNGSDNNEKNQQPSNSCEKRRVISCSPNSLQQQRRRRSSVAFGDGSKWVNTDEDAKSIKSNISSDVDTFNASEGLRQRRSPNTIPNTIADAVVPEVVVDGSLHCTNLSPVGMLHTPHPSSSPPFQSLTPTLSEQSQLQRSVDDGDEEVK